MGDWCLAGCGGAGDGFTGLPGESWLSAEPSGCLGVQPGPGSGGCQLGCIQRWVQVGGGWLPGRAWCGPDRLFYMEFLVCVMCICCTSFFLLVNTSFF